MLNDTEEQLRKLVEECVLTGRPNLCQELFAIVANHMAYEVDAWAESKGWNADDPSRGDGTCPEAIRQNVLQHDCMKIALMHSELSEGLEGLRHGNPPSEHIPDFTAVEEELADTIIRILHYSGRRQLRIGQAVVTKMAFNAGRPYKHGKQC
jgi:NTP pyrophosphatase (non-canonical NTP hydrolase)